MSINLNNIKVRLEDFQYGTDGKEVTWGTAKVFVYNPEKGWAGLGKVRAVVKLHAEDVFHESTGRKLVFNILQRKALDRLSKQIKNAQKILVKKLAEVNELATSLDEKNKDLEITFKSLSYLD